MASGPSSHQRHHHGHQRHNKISPRKFSEKIALLNKNEREGNAKFEEIIKEVQATRCQQQHQQPFESRTLSTCFDNPGPLLQQSAPILNTQSEEDDYRDGLRQVYDDLIKSCATDHYDEGLIDDTAQQTVTEEKSAFRSASAGLECTNNNCCPDSTQLPTISSQNHQSQNETGLIDQPLVYSQQSGSSSATGQRARVISFGSATNYKYLCANNSISSANNESNWTPCNQNQEYLTPSCDRQKSCSDPALHAIPLNSIGLNQLDQQSPRGTAVDNVETGLPGIKICTIEDESTSTKNVANLMNHNGSSSVDSSLPDISRIQFDSCALEKNIPATGLTFNDSCQALDGSWTSCDQCPNLNSIDDSNNNHLITPSQQQHSHQHSDNYLNGCRNETCWPNHIKVNNLLSSSDCGLTSGHTNHHHQHGSLMISTTSDLYNNIMRSRSHSNIDYLAKQNRAIVNIADHESTSFSNYPYNSQVNSNRQYIKQSGQIISSKRVYDLKAHESSVSPAGSSSNLNSPQSDLNSPSSSTADCCDVTMVYNKNTVAPAAQIQQTSLISSTTQDCYQYENQLIAATDCPTTTSATTSATGTMDGSYMPIQYEAYVQVSPQQMIYNQDPCNQGQPMFPQIDSIQQEPPTHQQQNRNTTSTSESYQVTRQQQNDGRGAFVPFQNRL